MQTGVNSNQSTLNTCVVALAQNATKPRLAITTTIAYLPSEIAGATVDGKKKSLAAIFGQPNLFVVRLDATVSCNISFKALGFGLANPDGMDMKMMWKGNQPNDKTATIQMASPSWGAKQILVIWIMTDSDPGASPIKL